MAESPFRFDFDEVVRVVSDDPELAGINGERGVVVGKGEDASAPGYGVFIYREERVWSVEERDLEPTGEWDRREPPTHAVRVAVDDRGRGEVVGVRALEAPMPHPGVRIPPPLWFVLGLLGGWALGRAWPAPLVAAERTGVLVVVGIALVGLGVALGAWAVLTFRRARTHIFPHFPASTIVEAGPYRITRNPMYLAMTLGYLGGTLVMNSAWPLALLPVVLAVLTVAVIRREERYLVSAFGEDYEGYRQRVRRWL